MTPKFYTTKRDGKVALWVSMPDGADRNIWDISSHNWSEEVQKAIVSAFYRGAECQQNLVSRCRVEGRYDQRFDEEEK
jgi:hypothetical protein